MVRAATIAAAALAVLLAPVSPARPATAPAADGLREDPGATPPRPRPHVLAPAPMHPRSLPAELRLLPPSDHLALGRVLRAVEKGRWHEAELRARGIASPLARKVAHWLWLTGPAPRATFAEMRDFLAENPDWPKARALRGEMERRMPSGIDSSTALALFAEHPPSTGAGLLRLAESLKAAGRSDEAFAAAREAWRGRELTRSDERRLLRGFGQFLAEEDQHARLDAMIWKRDWSAARNQLRRVKGVKRLVGEARILLGTRGPNVDQAIARIPESARDDPGLVYERIRWRRRSGLHEGARELMTDLPENLGRTSRWWRETKIQIRRLLARGRTGEAYRLAAPYGRFEGIVEVEADWIAGWLALEFERRERRALWHFRAMRGSVGLPISVARAEYWSARAARALGLHEEVESHLRAASAHPETFYGQAALSALNLPLRLPEAAEPGAEATIRLRESELGMVLRMLGEAEGHKAALPVALHLADRAGTKKEIAALHALCMDLAMPRLAIAAAKRGVRNGVSIPRLLFPVPARRILPHLGVGPVPRPLILAVANQESAFDRAAVSRAGARGLMQLMPATARRYAKLIGVSYRPSDLVEDPLYNLQLGQAVLADMLDRFDQATPLALAAYNAGEQRVRQWIKDYGDPRAGEVRMANWIELIPVAETRNYVQRVLEGEAVYEALADG